MPRFESTIAHFLFYWGTLFRAMMFQDLRKPPFNHPFLYRELAIL